MRTTHTTRRFAALIAAVFVTTLVAGHAQQSEVRAMFDEAVHWQEVKGDLQKAMTIYRTIVERHSTDAVAPRALLELAGCYEKLGSPEATGIYQQIVSQYASSASATRARAKLAEQATSSSTARRLWTEGVTGRVSPDGKYIATSDTATGDLVTRDTATGRIRRLTNNTVRANPGGPYVFSEPVPSPDSQSIAYSWFQPDSKRYELRVISRDGGAPRTLYASTEESNNRPVGWFPDGKSLLMSVSSGTTQRIATRLLRINLTGGQPTPISGFNPENAGGVQLSPDGQFVVFDQAAAGTGQERDIYVHSIADGKSWPVVQHPSSDRALAWFPTSDRILFSSDRSATFGIWQIKLTNGRPTGEPSLVKGDVRPPTTVGITKAGDFYYVVGSQESIVQIATLDARTGKLAGSVSRLQGRYIGGQTYAMWSPDGQRLAYLQATRFGAAAVGRGGRGGPAAGQPRLAIQTMATGDIRLLDVGANLLTPSWTPDGKAILLSGQSAGPNGVLQPGLLRVDVATGAVTAITSRDPNSPNPNLSLPTIGPDGTLFFRRYLGRPNGVASGELLRRDLSTGTEQKISDDVGHFTLSPDGRSFAIRPSGVPARRVVILPVSGGTPRTLLETEDMAPLQNATAWTRDSRAVYVVRVKGNIREIWRVPVDGSAPVDTGLRFDDVVGAISVHPDGRLAISTNAITLETWVLPKLARSLR